MLRPDLVSMLSCALPAENTAVFTQRYFAAENAAPIRPNVRPARPEREWREHYAKKPLDDLIEAHAFSVTKYPSTNFVAASRQAESSTVAQPTLARCNPVPSFWQRKK